MKGDLVMIKSIRFNKKMTVNIVLILFVVVLFILPLIIQPTADFSGADSIAQDLISEVNAQYEPWFKPLWSPPSTEIESAIFAIQAAVGSGVLFFVLGYLVGKNKSITNDKEVEKKYSE